MHILKFTDTLARSFFLSLSLFPQTQLLKKLSFLNFRFFLTLTLYLFLTPKLPLNVKATSAGNGVMLENLHLSSSSSSSSQSVNNFPSHDEFSCFADFYLRLMLLLLLLCCFFCLFSSCITFSPTFR